jgi:hypothetical protein
MRRFPLLRGYKQSSILSAPDASFDAGRVRRHEDVVEGAFVWRYDPVFRPMVAIYAEGCLKQLGTTYRRATHERRSWPCCFSIELDEELADRQDLTIAVLETGDILFAPPRTGQTIRTVEDLIDDARQQGPSFSYGGFISFLLLPLNDQIDILCHDLLDRGVHAEELAHYRRKVIGGEFSILGVRDDIAMTEEAEEVLAALTLHERRGRACLWQGLDEVLDHVIPPPLAREDFGYGTPPVLCSAFEEISVPTDVRGILAFNAVGDTIDVGAYAQWMTAYQNIAVAVQSRVSRSADLHARQNARDRRYRLNGLLSSMKLGQNALRLPGGAVQSVGEGVVVFGPYVALAAGRYTAKVSLRCITPALAQLQLEVVHGDIVFARRNVVLAGMSPETIDLPFGVPSGHDELLRAPKFELRISSSGADVVCEAVMLEVYEDPAIASTISPDVEDWLPFLTPEAAGRRRDDGTIRALMPSGRVFFGPYCMLLPGRYTLTLDYAHEGAAAKEAVLEVAAGGDAVLAHKRFELNAGHSSETLVFDVADADSAATLAGPLEFRLWKAEGFVFQCLAVRLAAPGDESLG